MRGSLGGFENPEKIFISFCYRAVYFSTFILLILFRQQIKKLPIINGGNNDDPEKSLMNLIKDNGITLPLATALMLVMVFTLQTPVVASALAIGQISLQIGNIIVVSFVGVLYMTEGRGPTRMGRLKEIFIGNENHGISKFYYLWAYFLFLAIAVMWAIMSIAA